MRTPQARLTPEYWEQWVRVLNLLGSIVLFLGSYRGQAWLKTQAKILDHATKRRISGKVVDKVHEQPLVDRSDDFDRAVEAFAIQPYFDRRAYVYLCVGFAITTFASIIDIVSHRSIQFLYRYLTHRLAP